MNTSAITHLPEELWIQLALTLRDFIPCPHGHTLAYDRPCLMRRHPTCSETRIHDLVSLSTTCRFLHNTVGPLLYHHVRLDATAQQGGCQLAQMLLRRPNLLSKTRELLIDGFDITRDHIITEILSAIPNVRSITISRCQIPSFYVGVLHRILNLSRLDIVDCRYSTEKRAECPLLVHSRRVPEGTGLKHLTLRAAVPNPDYPNIPVHINPYTPSLLTITIDSNGMSDLLRRLDSKTLSLDHLNTFRLEVSNPAFDHQEMIVRLASHCDIHEITMTEKSPAGRSYNFPPEVFPNLRILRGPISFTMALSCGRPIETLQTVVATPKNGIDDIRIQTPSLKTLVIQGIKEDDDTIEKISQMCPGLISLRLRSHALPHRTKTWIGSRLSEDIGLLPALQELVIENLWQAVLGERTSEELPAEREVLTRIKTTHCPNLSEACFPGKRHWVYVDGWIPVLRPQW